MRYKHKYRRATIFLVVLQKLLNNRSFPINQLLLCSHFTNLIYESYFSLNISFFNSHDLSNTIACSSLHNLSKFLGLY